MAFEPEDFAGKSLKLNSPASQGTLEISWPHTKDLEVHQARIKELTDTVKFVCEDFKFIQVSTRTAIADFEDFRTFQNASKLVKEFNRGVSLYTKLNKGTQEYYQKCQRKASSAALDHILKQVYRQSITDPQSLNKYQSFTSETYGETNYQQMDRILSELDWNENDVFVDLGSGIGSIVMQVAASANISRAVGIELQPNPNKAAKFMDENFRKMMKWYGKIFTDYHLYAGNFLEKTYEDVKTAKDATFDWRAEATVIFVNNFAFNEDLNLQLKEVFGREMNNNTKIISTKAFCPLDFKINERNAGKDIGCFMRVSEMPSIEDGFSWTNKVVQVFLSVIDHTKLEEYYYSKGKKERSKDRSSSNSPIDFVDSPKPKINIKTTIPKKMSKGRVEPPEKIPEKNSRTRNGDSTKRGRPGKTLKIMQDPQTRHALEAFETAQIRSHRSHHNNARQNSLTKKQIDEAWDVATEEWKKKFQESLSTFLNLSQNRLDKLYEGEKQSLAKLDQMVKEEEKKIDELRQKATRRYESSIRTQVELKSQKVMKREAAVSLEDVEIRRLQEKILRNGFSEDKKFNNHIKRENGHLQVRPSIIRHANSAKIKSEPIPDVRSSGYVRCPVSLPSPQSIPPSPHSFKSSPTNDKSETHSQNALITAGIKNVMSPRMERELKPTENPANHFPINLTPTPTVQNSCESGNASPSSSAYAGSPHPKRKRIQSVDSDRSNRSNSDRSNSVPSQGVIQSVIQSNVMSGNTGNTQVQTTSSTQPPSKNTSTQSRVPNPQHHIQMVPPPVMMHQGVIRHHSVSRPTSETQERNESSVLFGGLNHAYVQFPTAAQFPLQKGHEFKETRPLGSGTTNGHRHIEPANLVARHPMVYLPAAGYMSRMPGHVMSHLQLQNQFLGLPNQTVISNPPPPVQSKKIEK